MIIQSLHLENFRSYEVLELGFDEGLTVLHGPNASGKTNLLEAIAMLALGGSPIATEEADVFRWGTDHYRINARMKKDKGEELEFELISQLQPRKAKAFRLNGVKKHAGDVLGTLPVVLFLPSDLELFTGPPDLRRRLLNQLLCQVSLEYRLALDEYRRVLKQRNALLKQLTTDSRQLTTRLHPWDEKVAELGSEIIVERKQLVAALNLSLREEMKAFGEEVMEARLEYKHHGATIEGKEDSPRRASGRQRGEASRGKQRESLKQSLLAELQCVHERDIILQATTIGPHRDDLSLLLDDRDVVTFASRGQQRSCVLALLLLQATYLELKLAEKPVLLLDDVFSELDEHHEKAVLAACHRYQTLITATHLPEMLPRETEVLKCPLMRVGLVRTS